MYEQFKVTEEQFSELKGLEKYIHWLLQLEEQKKSIYTLSESELNYLVSFAETNTGRGSVFAKNILCELYGICLEDEIIRGFENEMMNAEEQKSRNAEDSYGLMVLRSYGLENITLVPNPTTGELTITNYELRITDIEIFDVYGRNLTPHTSHRLSHTTIDISHFPAGIYFVKITTETGIITKKIIKN